MTKKIISFRSFCFLVGIIILFLQPMLGQKLPADYLNFFHFRSIGPTRQGGRISDFAVCRHNSKIFYVAAATGGCCLQA